MVEATMARPGFIQGVHFMGKETMTAPTAGQQKVRSSRRRHGFTLIELLVVVAVIAVLVAILLPALGRARDRAKATLCSGNLRQFAVGFVLYGNDNGEHLPTTGDYPRSLYCGQKTDNWIYLLSRAVLPSKSDPWAYYGYKPGGDVWWCPSDKRTPNGSGYVDGPSYGINPFLTGFYSSAYGNPGSYQISKIPEPAKTPILFDCDNPYRACPCHIEDRYGQGYGAHFFPHPHQNGDIFLYVDGHAGWVPNLDVAGSPEYSRLAYCAVWNGQYFVCNWWDSGWRFWL